MASVTRHLVLDSAGVSALVRDDDSDRARAEVFLAIAAANGRRVVPTAVRCEAGWRRADRTAANANRLVPEDDDLDRSGADRVVGLRRAVSSASLVDATVAVAAERLADGAVVEVLTSDRPDLERLAGHVQGRVQVRAL